MSVKIILASNSPRRKELLSKLVAQFDIVPAILPEHSDKQNPREYVCELAQHKAEEVFGKSPQCLVIGSDTVVELDGKILGKPHSNGEAEQMLSALSGKTHLVHTGVCILYKNSRRVFCDTSSVTFRNIPRQDLVRYVQSGAPLDKAGGYGIQDCGFVQSFDGSYDNILGFPTQKIAKILDEITKGENYGKLSTCF